MNFLLNKYGNTGKFIKIGLVNMGSFLSNAFKAASKAVEFVVNEANDYAIRNEGKFRETLEANRGNMSREEYEEKLNNINTVMARAKSNLDENKQDVSVQELISMFRQKSQDWTESDFKDRIEEFESRHMMEHTTAIRFLYKEYLHNKDNPKDNYSSEKPKDEVADFGMTEEEKLHEQVVAGLIENDKLVWKKVDGSYFCIMQNPYRKFTLGDEGNPVLTIDTDDYKGAISGKPAKELWDHLQAQFDKSNLDGLRNLANSLKK